MGKRAAGAQQQLEGIVQAARVRLLGFEEGAKLADALPPHRRPGVHLAAHHPRPVGTDGVDLTVVGDAAERLSDRPGGERVRRVPLVEYGERGLEGRVAQVPVELVDLAGGEQPLVDHGPARCGRDGEALEMGTLALHRLAGEEEVAFEGLLVPLGRSRHDRLFDSRERGSGPLRERRRVDGHHPPGEQTDVLGRQSLIDDRSPLPRAVSR